MKNYKDFTSELADIIPYIEKQDGEKILICDSDDPKITTVGHNVIIDKHNGFKTIRVLLPHSSIEIMEEINNGRGQFEGDKKAGIDLLKRIENKGKTK